MIINEIELPDLQLPRRSLKLVLMQPYIKLEQGNEPFRWIANGTDDQLNAIHRTLTISNSEPEDHAHFTVFPEYSIPGPTGVKAINNFIRGEKCVNGCIVIGCVDGLTASEFLEVMDSEIISIHEQTRPRVQANQWINCVITWVKSLDRNVSAWAQLKIVPARPERATECTSMLSGDVVHIFKTKFDDATNCRFLNLICFDWIGRNSSGDGIQGVIAALNEVWKTGGGEKKELSFVFLPQYNPKPSDHEFMGNTENFFRKGSESPFVDRSNCIVVMCNVAEGQSLGTYSSFGCSSLVSHPRAGYDTKCCEPSYALVSPGFGRSSLGWCTDARLREMGACIHSLTIRVPQSIDAAANDRTFPIEIASVFPVDPNQRDPRAPGAPVPASVKWTNDHLDSIKPILLSDPSHPLKPVVDAAHNDIVQRLRLKDGSSLRKLVFPLASPTLGSETSKWIIFSNNRNIPNIDLWDNKEVECLKSVVDTLTLFSIIQRVDLILRDVHATITLNKDVYDIIVVTGADTHEECYEYAQKVTRGAREQGFLVVITKNVDNRHFIQKPVFFTDPRPISPAGGPKFTNPSNKIFRLGFQDLFSFVEGVRTDVEFQTKLWDVFLQQSN